MTALATASSIFDQLGQLSDLYRNGAYFDRFYTPEEVHGPVKPPVKFYLKEEGCEEIELVAFRCLGFGGSKKALSLSDGRVLLIPGPVGGLALWDRIIQEEVEWSQHFREHGLLAVTSKRVEIRGSKEEAFCPAYISLSFASLAEKHIYIRDNKNTMSSTWNPDNFEDMSYNDKCLHGGYRPIFTNKVDSLDVEKWFPLFSDLIDDVARMQSTFFCPGGDCLNFAVITHEDKVPQSIRPFLFDFSSKGRRNPLEGRVAEPVDKAGIAQRINTILTAFLFSLYQDRLGITYEEQTEMIAKLTDRCMAEYCRRYLPSDVV